MIAWPTVSHWKIYAENRATTNVANHPFFAFANEPVQSMHETPLTFSQTAHAERKLRRTHTPHTHGAERERRNQGNTCFALSLGNRAVVVPAS